MHESIKQHRFLNHDSSRLIHTITSTLSSYLYLYPKTRGLKFFSRHSLVVHNVRFSDSVLDSNIGHHHKNFNPSRPGFRSVP